MAQHTDGLEFGRPVSAFDVGHRFAPTTSNAPGHTPASPAFTPALSHGNYFLDANHSVVPLNMKAFAGAATDGPIKVGGIGGPVANDFSNVHLASNGTHWTLTDGVNTIQLTGATEVYLNGQNYVLVDHFGAGTGGYQSVQAGVDHSHAGDIVLVAGGDYLEQVVVDSKSNLTIQGLSGDDVNLKAPTDMVQHGTSSSGRALNSVVTVNNSTNVELKDVDVDGDGKGGTVDGSNANFLGVVYRNASGGMTDVDVTGVHESTINGVQRGVGVQVDNDSLLSFFMHGGSITDFQKNATVFNYADLDVSGVTVTGAGAFALNAQNGMQAGNCTGSISDCDISGIGYSGTTGNPANDSYSAGILLTGNNSNLSVHDNTIVGANIDDANAKIVGIYVYDGLGANNGGGVTDNDVSYCDTGVGVYGDFGASGFDVSGNSVLHVDLNDHYVQIDSGFGGVDFEPNSAGTTAFNVSGSEADDYISGASQGDTLTGGDGNDHMFGNGGADNLSGEDGNDTMDGGTGADSMTGGAGNDTYLVDNSGDTTVEASSGGTDTVLASTDYALGAGQEIENLTGNAGSTGLHLTGNEGGQTITGLGGNDTLTGGGGNDHIVGGAGNDTATYADSLSTSNFAYSAGTWTVTTATEGTDTLEGVEKITDGGGHNVLLVDPMGSYTSIQDAINAASDGDIILVGAGTYNENVIVNKGVTIQGLAGAKLQGSFKADNGIADGQVESFLEAGNPYSQAAGRGFDIQADNVKISGIEINGFQFGINLADGVDGATLENVDFIDNLVGVHKGTNATITDFTMTGGSMVDGLIGLEFYKSTAGADYNTSGSADGILIDGVDLSQLALKGLYFEAASDAHVTNFTMNDVGQFGAPSTSGVAGSGGNGVDFNLKNGVYHDLEVDNFTLTNTGNSDRNGLDAFGHQNGGAIVIEGRDAGSYAGAIGTINGTVYIHDGSINGTSTGVQVGEPGQANTHGPNVDIDNVTITGEDHSTTPPHGDITNVASTSTTTWHGTASAETIDASRSTGKVVFEGNGGNDTLTGGSNTGDTSVYSGNLADYSLSDTGGVLTVADSRGGAPDGSDQLTGIEHLDMGDHDVWVVSSGGSVQTAINAAAAGDTVYIESGTYVGDLVVNKALTIVGHNNGVDGDDARTNESAIQGTIQVTAASGSVVLDGLEFLNTSNNSTQYIGVRIQNGADVTVQNSVFYSTGPNGNAEDRAINLDTSVSGHISILDNYITGASAAKYSTASWQRGVWSDGSEASLTITGNTFEYVRSALNLDSYDDNAVDIGNNIFRSGGTAISLGGPVVATGSIVNIHDNGFYDVDSDFNLRNILSSYAQSLDLTATHNTAYAFGSDSTGIMWVYGTDGADTLSGTAGSDILDARDVLEGIPDSANNTLNGNGGNDLLVGANGADTLNGGTGADDMRGGAGGDTYYVDDAGDVVTETGSGKDLIISSVDYILGTKQEDLTLTGSALNGSGNGKANVIIGNGQDNGLDGANGQDKLYGNDGSDALTGGGNSDQLFGGNGTDTLLGGSGDDTLDGGTGADSMIGGSGNDTFYVDNIGDVVSDASGVEKVVSSIDYTLGANIENLDLSTGAANGTGNSGANVINGNNGDNTISGLGGDDTLDGGVGRDLIVGGSGIDTMTGGQGADKFVFNLTSETGTTAATNDIIVDFGVDNDHIDLRGIDADTFTGGDQHFTFIGTSSFSNVAGQLRYEQISGNTFVQGDVNGDGTLDFQIELTGLHSLVNTDFLL